MVFIHGFSLHSVIWEMGGGESYEEYFVGAFILLVYKENRTLIREEFNVEKGYRVLTFDLYGRGSSVGPDTLYTAQLFVGQLVELLYTLNLTDTPFILVGYSMGGYLNQPLC